jgi:hypothetical protein
MYFYQMCLKTLAEVMCHARKKASEERLLIDLVRMLLSSAGDRWDYDIFISHAGPKKHLARDLEDELKHLGFRSFVDVNGLLPGDNADAKMRERPKERP